MSKDIILIFENVCFSSESLTSESLCAPSVASANLLRFLFQKFKKGKGKNIIPRTTFVVVVVVQD